MSLGLILVCNASKAFLYGAHKRYTKEHLQFIEELTHTKSRKKGTSLLTDRPGHYQTDHKARGSYDPAFKIQECEKNNFAKEIAEYLGKYHQNHPFQKLTIIAPPHFFGLLKKYLSDSIFQTLHRIIQKDYTFKKELELRKILQQTENDLMHINYGEAR